VRKKPVFGGIILVIIAIIIIFGEMINPDDIESVQNDNGVFHVTLANPALYEKGAYVKEFQIEKGVYEFRFVPNGDSPQKLSVKLLGESGIVLMDNHFELRGNLVEDELSSWYTWDYFSENNRISFDEIELVKIIVNPNGNYNGPVSIDLIKLR